MERADRELPIDINFSKLADWLVDRKKVPVDWHKRLSTVRKRVETAFVALPKDADPWFALLTLESTRYLESRRIRDMLVEAKAGTRSFFGWRSGAVGDWDAIVRAYEKDCLFLGEAAQVMLQNANYEIPYQKKQILKTQQLLGDLERKEVEYKRSAAAAAVKYQQICEELGIEGKNVRKELLAATTQTLPDLFTEIVDMLCGNGVGQAKDYYQTFVSCTNHKQERVGTYDVAPTLKELREDPPKSHLLENEKSCENPTTRPTSDASLFATMENLDPTKNEASSINWDIALGENREASIDWNLDDNANLNDGHEEPQVGLVVESSNSMETGLQGNLLLGEVELSLEEVSDINWSYGDAGEDPNFQSEIQWDISIEDGLDSLDETVWDPSKPTIVPSEKVEDEPKLTISSCFLEADYRNRLLDDLFEIRAFLMERVEEMNRSDATSLLNQVQTVAPAALQQYGTDTLQSMATDLSRSIKLLTSQKTRDLIMILTSKRFLDRLEGSVNQKKQQEHKSLESLKDLSLKRVELRNTLTVLWHKQESSMKQIKDLKELVESTLSRLYDGRRINIIGEINAILNQA